ncbi:MAG: hypothetical protein SOZ11_04190 [Bacilli bacterium]|nr:hypothetical protein [Bacilli bacterium]
MSKNKKKKKKKTNIFARILGITFCILMLGSSLLGFLVYLFK